MDVSSAFDSAYDRMHFRFSIFSCSFYIQYLYVALDKSVHNYVNKFDYFWASLEAQARTSHPSDHDNSFPPNSESFQRCTTQTRRVTMQD